MSSLAKSAAADAAADTADTAAADAAAAAAAEDEGDNADDGDDGDDAVAAAPPFAGDAMFEEGAEVELEAAAGVLLLYVGGETNISSANALNSAAVCLQKNSSVICSCIPAIIRSNIICR